ncbi:DUF551 domain-containing protein [Escherichia coli]|nr:DUF551 domain-containing protein [Escherichia coli]EKG7033981.1 DUF551 domain-containing protein [Escherichia coli]
MTTITKERIELFIKNPLENGLTRGEQMELARIALASLGAEPLCYLTWHQGFRAPDDCEEYVVEAKPGDKSCDGTPAFPVYTAPPVPVSVPTFEKWCELTEQKPVGWVRDAMKEAYDACRAAMLHSAEPASNHEELPLDYLQGQKDGLEWAAQLAEANHPQTGDWLYDDPLELAKAIRKGPDMPEFDGPTPVIPDGWINCSERMPNDKQYVWCWGKSYGWTECDTFEGYYDWSRNKWWAITDDGEEPASKVTHWMTLPEPPL